MRKEMRREGKSDLVDQCGEWKVDEENGRKKIKMKIIECRENPY